MCPEGHDMRPLMLEHEIAVGEPGELWTPLWYPLCRHVSEFGAGIKTGHDPFSGTEYHLSVSGRLAEFAVFACRLYAVAEEPCLL